MHPATVSNASRGPVPHDCAGSRAPLWELGPRGARKIRDSGVDSYLAGETGGRMVWNRRTAACDDWGLFASDGSLITCGAATTDPVAYPDPAFEHEHHDGHDGRDEGTPTDAVAAVVVGDFATRGAARRVAGGLGTGRIVGHAAAPAAVRPGAYVVAVPVPAHHDPARALSGLRKAHPAFAGRMWVAPLD